MLLGCILKGELVLLGMRSVLELNIKLSGDGSYDANNHRDSQNNKTTCRNTNQTTMSSPPCCSGNTSPHHKDSAWSWVVCAAGTFSTVIIMGFNICFAVVMPVLLDHFKETRQKIAWIGSICLCLTFFASPLAGVFISRFDFRLAAIIGAMSCSISLLLTSFTMATLHLFFSYSLLYGLGSCFLYMSSVYAVADYFDKRRGLALGMLTAGMNIGVLSLGPLLQVLIDAYGWRTMYRILAGAMGLVVLLVMTYDSNVVKNREQQTGGESTGQASESKYRLVVETLKTPAYVIAVVTLTLEALTAFVSYVHLVNYCVEVGISAQQASNLFIYIGACALASSIATGRILDIRAINPFHVNQTAAVTMAISMLLLPLATKYMHFMVFAVFLGLGLGCFVTTILVLVLVTVRPELTVVSYPIGQLITSLGNASGAPLAGFIADLYGSYDPAFYTIGSIMLLAAFVPFLQYCFKPWREAATPSAAGEERNGSSLPREDEESLELDVLTDKDKEK